MILWNNGLVGAMRSDEFGKIKIRLPKRIRVQRFREEHMSCMKSFPIVRNNTSSGSIGDGSLRELVQTFSQQDFAFLVTNEAVDLPNLHSIGFDEMTDVVFPIEKSKDIPP
jgi:hypothetical protein